MVKKVKRKAEAIQFCYWLRNVPVWKERANSLLENLAVHNSEETEQIKLLRLSLGTSPDKVYDSMPIAAI